MTDRRFGMGDAPMRDNGPYLRNRREFRARCKSGKVPCAICGEPIDYDAEPNTAKAFELDHIKPVKTHPHLFYLDSNWQPTHCACNRSRQAKAMLQPAAVEVGAWVKPRW